MNKKTKKTTPRTLSGFMELLPSEQILFNWLKERIRSSYERFGFLPLDTPIIEASEVLLAKTEGETEKQIYTLKKGDTGLALRFDLTVPLAKYVAIHQNELVFPFRRYQIGKVYRGERPQQGRFREFYQFDIDVVGNEELSIMYDAEIPSIIYATFTELGLNDFTIKINNRKILSGLFTSLGADEQQATNIMRIIDKKDKIGEDAVIGELKNIDIEFKNIKTIMNFLNISGTTEEKLAILKSMNIANEIFKVGVEELSQVIQVVKMFDVPSSNYMIDLNIARGLDYYTGTVYETTLNQYPEIGSICSGGRYDNLLDFYSNKKIPGVGISIGLTRLFYQLNKKKILNLNKTSTADVLIIPMEEENLEICLKTATTLRSKKINTEIFLANKKIKSKFSYADKLNIPYVIIVGEKETEVKKFSLKNLKTNEQKILTLDEIIAEIQKNQNF